MNNIHYPIFRKDFAILLKFTIAALAVQAIIMIVYPSIAPMIDHRIGDLADWMPQVQLAICVLVALMAAGYWYTEERAGGNLALLFRLPVSSKRIWTEKTSAAIGALMILWLFQVLWCMEFYSGSKSFSSSSLFFFVMMLLVLSIFAYVVGLPLSRYLKQTISVVLIGIVAVVVLGYSLAIGCALIYDFLCKLFFWKYKKLGFDAYLLIGALSILIVYGYIVLRHTVFIKSKSRFDRLSFVYYSQNRLYIWLTVGGLLLSIVCFIIVGNPYDSNIRRLVFLAFSICGLVSVAIGVSTYSNDEKHGLKNVLYYQPISLSHLYWMRWLSGLCLALIPASCLVVLLLAGVNLSPADAENFHPLLAVFYFLFFGLIPFTVGAFTTHVIRNALYAFFESVVAYAISLALILNTVTNGSVWLIQSYNDMPYRNNPLDFNSFFNVSLFLFAGFALAGWRTATDRELLTRGTLYRQLYVARLFLFVLVVTFALVKTGWKDFFYLVTGIDIGIG